MGGGGGRREYIIHTEKRAQITRIQFDGKKKKSKTENSIAFFKVSWTEAVVLNVWSPDQQYGDGVQVVLMHTCVWEPLK